MKNEYRLLRHATLLLKINNLNILVDPMLSDKDAMEPIAGAASGCRFPMVDLPIKKNALNGLLESLDAVIITHTHRDHWDVAAQQLLDKGIAIICQPSDEKEIKEQGFTHIFPVDVSIDFHGIKIIRTNGKHGTGEIGDMMGHVSGFVLQDGSDTLYIAGDTIWYEEVEKNLVSFRPDVTVVNAGAPRFLTGDPVTMDEKDVISVALSYTKTKVIAVHMETVNHCTLSRQELKTAVEVAGLANRIVVPKDGAIF